MNETLLLFALLCGAILLLIVFLVYRDNSFTRRMRVYEAGIETLNRELFKMENRLKTQQQELISALENDLKRQSAEAIAGSIRHLQDSLQTEAIERDTQNMRIDRLEERITEFLSVPGTASLDASRAISLHQSGYSVEEIARDMRANVSEVALALKLNNLEPRRH